MTHATTLRQAALAIAVSALAGTSALAADLHFSGNAVLDTDVVEIAFTLQSDAVDVRLGTDSWQDGVNFDPTSALWLQTSAGYSFIAFNDDTDTPFAGQGAFDTGLTLSTLAAGSYLYTVAAAPNTPNAALAATPGGLLSDGFSFDGTTPIPIAQWDQPGYDINTAQSQKGTLWSVTLMGVDAATVIAPVPEPATWTLLAAGLGALCLARRGRRSGRGGSGALVRPPAGR